MDAAGVSVVVVTDHGHGGGHSDDAVTSLLAHFYLSWLHLAAAPSRECGTQGV